MKACGQPESVVKGYNSRIQSYNKRRNKVTKYTIGSYRRLQRPRGLIDVKHYTRWCYNCQTRVATPSQNPHRHRPLST